MKKRDSKHKNKKPLEDHVLTRLSALLSLATPKQIRKSLIEVLLLYVSAETENFHDSTYLDNVNHFKYLLDFIDEIEALDQTQLQQHLKTRMR